jgi:high-affinity K+ transport system ATPase subunit B
LPARLSAIATTPLIMTTFSPDLVFLGLQGMIDPPRPEAIAAVHACQSAGIQVKMITGDHIATARAIAHRMGIQQSDQVTPLRANSWWRWTMPNWPRPLPMGMCLPESPRPRNCGW